MKRTLAFLLSLPLAITLAACSSPTNNGSTNNGSTTTESTSSDTANKPDMDKTEQTETATPTEDESLSALRKSTADAGKVFAIIDLGMSDAATDSATPYDTDQLSLETYPFIKDIDAEHIVVSPDGASNVFCLVPANAKTSVSVHAASISSSGELEKGDELYASEKGDPIILRCMVGDVITGVVVTMEGPDGTTVEDYMPFYSGKDGSLLTTDGNGADCALNATVYGENYNGAGPASADDAETALRGTTEVADALEAGSSLEYEGHETVLCEGIETDCYVFALGEDHTDHWVTADRYAVANDGFIYKYDAVNDTWSYLME
ncbi:MAG: hypothetical protein ACOYJL_03405 [Tractidigestivibacter sp.]|jgi:hypothetical protein|uniref:hypothetical protein n=1 Tax=Tractidigestivibacter sp. TaxID=2847320 RepID=UPI003D8ACEC5